MSSAKFQIHEHRLPAQHIREYPRATANEQEDVLYLAIKEYRPLDNFSPQPGDVTIISAHANGYPKELYEPLWDELLARSAANGFRIRGIWIADAAHQGASSILNEKLMGDDPSWDDHPRDLLHMINHFRDRMPRPLVGIGHSMGGQALVNLALMHPRLLTTLVLYDPVIQASRPIGSPSPPQASTFRRDLWPSRAEAEASFRASKFYQRWDKRVLDLWLQHGLRRTPTSIFPADSTPPGSVTLATTKHQEVWSFIRSNYNGKAADGTPLPDMEPDRASDIFYRPETLKTLNNLPFLRPSVMYVFAGQASIFARSQDEKMKMTGVGIGGNGGVAAGKVRQVTLKRGSHLMPMELVAECADVASGWIGDQLKRFFVEEAEFRERWAGKSLIEKQTVSDEWKVRVGGDPRLGPKSGNTKL